MEVKIYSTPTCGYCHMAKKYLSEKGIAYKEYDVSVDRDAAHEMVNLTGQMGVPVIIVDNEIVVGFDRSLLDRLLSKNGNGFKVALGLSIADAGKLADKTGLPPISGAFVGRVAPASPGERAGLKPGDIIKEINMQKVNNAADMERIVSSIKKGTMVEITYSRDDSSLKAELIV